VQILNARSERYAKGSTQAHMLGLLKANLRHFSPVEVIDDTCERISSRVEGVFGVYGSLAHHEVPPIDVIANGIRLLGQMAFVRRSHAQIPPLLPEIISYPDQKTWIFRRDDTSR
jgi:hypothetical protein